MPARDPAVRDSASPLALRRHLPFRKPASGATTPQVFLTPALDLMVEEGRAQAR
ncbi:hypothetical protein ACFP6A_00450 [Quadrisphaera sp. GCM10027208]|uniref:hypothetical protein n=1 Tax=Quadrisphaera sp. GCM10027208 TaxID=3273423 RepID=UPI00361E172B